MINMNIADINWLAIIVAAVASMVLGAIYYGPLFGKTWLRLSKIKALKMTWKHYLGGLITTLVTAFILAYMVSKFESNTWLLGLDLGFTMWIGFIAPIMFGIVLWERKPVRLYLLNVMFQLISLLVMAVILSIF